MITKDELITIIVSQVQLSGSVSALSKKLGVSLSYLSDVLRGTREPGEKVLNSIGYKRVVLFEKTKAGGK